MFEPDDAARLTERKRQVLASGRPSRGAISLGHPDGLRREYDLFLDVLRDPDAGVVGVTGVATYLAPERRTEST